MLYKLILLASLYTSQFIPTTFFIQALPVFMRQQNMPLDVIGYLGFLMLPSGLKFLWAPFIDRYHLGKLGHYRGWIICLQLLLISTTLTSAFIDIKNNLALLLISMFLMFLFSASQDIATDALAVNLLEPQERGIGNAIQSSGNILGAVIGGGVMLILLDKIGWQYSLIAMSFMLVLNLMPILLHQENIVIKPQQSNLFNSYIQSFVHFLKRPNIIPWLIVISLYMIADSVTSVLIRPLLADRGLSLSQIGWILGIVSYSARIVGALTAGIIIMRIGRYKSLIIFGFISAISTLLYIIPAIYVNSLPILYTVCILVNTIQSMAYTALLSAMMDKCTKSGAATDYTIQVSIIFLGGIGATVISGILAKATSYAFVFVVTTIMSLISVYLITKIRMTNLG